MSVGSTSSGGQNADAVSTASQDENENSECSINAEQQQLIDQLRKETADLLDDDYDTDFNLLRWLKAYQYNMAEVRQRLRRHLKMRALLDLEHVQRLDFSKDEVYTKYLPMGFIEDAGIGNRHVVFELAGRADPDGLMKCLQPTQFMMHRFQFLLRAHAAMNKSEATSGRQSGLVYIYDMQGCEMDPTLLPIVVGPLRILWLHISDNCPEMIYKLIIINSPSFINVLYRALSPFLPEHTKVSCI